jgi:lycopene cyclase-like protein
MMMTHRMALPAFVSQTSLTVRCLTPPAASITNPRLAPISAPAASSRRTRQAARRPRCIAAPAPVPQTAAEPLAQVPSRQQTYDVIVVGGGPAGLSLAAGLGKRGVHVLCCDPTLNRPWPNNYGTWLDELQPLGLDDCVSHIWEKCAAYVSSDGAKKTQLPRVYARVDRAKLKQRLLDICHNRTDGNVTIIDAAATEIATPTDNPAVSIVSFSGDIENDDINDTPLPPHPSVAGRVVVDATGHRLKFVQLNPGSSPGFQAAYGIECTVSEASYKMLAERDEMLLMDFRDDHMQATAADRAESSTEPTFIYVMPLDNGVGRRVFFEETSLVASPAMPFDQLKRRLELRLAHYGVTVELIHDEEFCLIPMGGEIPILRQRVVAFGGAAALVHPATGYMIARALTLADKCASIIASELSGNTLSNFEQTTEADAIAYRIWDRLWNVGRRRQRDFFNFGGEFLQKIDLATTRDFFSAFFDLPVDQWSGFLSFKLMQPVDRLNFGLGVFIRTTNRVRFSIVPASVIYGGAKLIKSVMPFYTVASEEESDGNDCQPSFAYSNVDAQPAVALDPAGSMPPP